MMSYWLVELSKVITDAQKCRGHNRITKRYQWFNGITQGSL